MDGGTGIISNNPTRLKRPGQAPGTRRQCQSIGQGDTPTALPPSQAPRFWRQSSVCPDATLPAAQAGSMWEPAVEGQGSNRELWRFSECCLLPEFQQSQQSGGGECVCHPSFLASWGFQLKLRTDCWHRLRGPYLFTRSDNLGVY